MHEARLTPDLPERFALLYDYKTKKFETPLDINGIANIDDVFELAIRTYPDELPDFSNTDRDRHHLYRSESWWRGFAESQEHETDRDTVHNFRNSAPQIAYVPRPIHEWIEKSQLSPPAPDLDTMRRRNIAWQSASLLLSTASRLDKAKSRYADNRGKTRLVLSHIPGITMKHSRLSDVPLQTIEVNDDEYWLSELEARLDSWRKIAQEIGSLSLGHGLLQTPRLADVRDLNSRLKNNAFVPQLDYRLTA